MQNVNNFFTMGLFLGSVLSIAAFIMVLIRNGKPKIEKSVDKKYDSDGLSENCVIKHECEKILPVHNGTVQKSKKGWQCRMKKECINNWSTVPSDTQLSDAFSKQTFSKC